jgi:hypothetical protein
MLRISVGMSRASLLKLAADIQNTFATEGDEQSLSFWGKENTIRDTLSGAEIVFSNEDMEGRTDLPADAVFFDVDEI